MELLSKVKNTVNKYNLLSDDDQVLVAVSGGADSIALLHILKQLQAEYKLDLHIAHLDHKLRGSESRADAKFVEKFASELNIPVTIKAVDVKEYQRNNKLSLEDAARQVRYQFFYNLLEELSFDKLAIAHHANDQVETILMKFLRGAGLKGLGGIEPNTEGVIRPLIEAEKEEIKQYCDKNNLDWRLDSTNQQEICLRNKIRLNLLPELITEYNNSLISNVNQMAEVLRTENQFLENKAQQLLSEVIIDNIIESKYIISKDKFLDLHLSMQRRIIRLLFKRLTGSYKNLYFHNVQEALELIKKDKTGIKTNLPEGVLIRINYRQIIFMLAEDVEKIDNFNYQVEVGEQLKIPELDLVINSKVLESDYPWQQEISIENKTFFDLDKVGKEFNIRLRKKGDSFQPLGMSGTKKVKDFFIDHKVPLVKRDRIPVFTTNDENIFCLGKLRIDDNYKVTDQTEKILMIETSNLEED